MDEAELKRIEMMNRAKNPNALWEQQQINRLIAEVRRLRAENEFNRGLLEGRTNDTNSDF